MTEESVKKQIENKKRWFRLICKFNYTISCVVSGRILHNHRLHRLRQISTQDWNEHPGPLGLQYPYDHHYVHDQDDFQVRNGIRKNHEKACRLQKNIERKYLRCFSEPPGHAQCYYIIFHRLSHLLCSQHHIMIITTYSSTIIKIIIIFVIITTCHLCSAHDTTWPSFRTLLCSPLPADVWTYRGLSIHHTLW